ncbi:MAG: hypothetical protein C4300_02180 [Thermus sp.]|uniref:hypothetical protein n=1 Tax=Thermus sp. TaxID=275 RepID=UPI00332E47C2
MRTVKELRLAGLFSYLAALVLGLLASLMVHALTGGGGKFGWEGFNFIGLLEGVFFLLVFTFALYLAQGAVRVPCGTLLTAGLVAPKPVRALARPVPLLDGLEAYEGRGVAVLVQEGRPVGVLGLSDQILPWEEAAVVGPEVAVTELRPLFWNRPAVFVAEGDRILGVVFREPLLTRGGMA